MNLTKKMRKYMQSFSLIKVLGDVLTNLDKEIKIFRLIRSPDLAGIIHLVCTQVFPRD